MSEGEGGDRSAQRRRRPRALSQEELGAWHKGWEGNPIYAGGALYRFRRTSFQASIERDYNRHTGNFKERAPFAEGKTQPSRVRDTWIQNHIRETHWQPGPGTYRVGREQPLTGKHANPEGEFLSTRNVLLERAPSWTFGKETKETRHAHKDWKAKRNHGRYPTGDEMEAPGPGTYTQFTQFGSSVGGSRKTWLGGPANNKHPWDSE